MRPLLIVKHVSFEGPGRLEPLIAAAGVPTRVLDAGPAAAWPDPAGLAGLLMLGGPQSVYDEGRWPWLAAENAFIQRTLDAQTPCLGICLGAQLLAKALGAPCRPNPAGKEIGWAEVALAPAAGADPLFAGLPGRFQAFHWHGDTFDLPAGARLLASSALTPHQAFAHGDHAWGLQFHLEVRAEDIRTWMREYESELKHALPGDLEGDLAAHFGPYTRHGDLVFGRFLDRVKARG